MWLILQWFRKLVAQAWNFFLQLICRKWSHKLSTLWAKLLRTGENTHKLHIVRMLNASTLNWIMSRRKLYPPGHSSLVNIVPWTLLMSPLILALAPGRCNKLEKRAWYQLFAHALVCKAHMKLCKGVSNDHLYDVVMNDDVTYIGF